MSISIMKYSICSLTERILQCGQANLGSLILVIYSSFLLHLGYIVDHIQSLTSTIQISVLPLMLFPRRPVCGCFFTLL